MNSERNGWRVISERDWFELSSSFLWHASPSLFKTVKRYWEARETQESKRGQAERITGEKRKKDYLAFRLRKQLVPWQLLKKSGAGLRSRGLSGGQFYSWVKEKNIRKIISDRRGIMGNQLLGIQTGWVKKHIKGQFQHGPPYSYEKGVEDLVTGIWNTKWGDECT